MDDIILRCATRRLREPKNRGFIKKQVVKRTYGFEYENHFRRMLIQLIGVINVEVLERSVDSTRQAQLQATLSSLKAIRNQQAHTHTKHYSSISAPSWTIVQFNAVYAGLLEIDQYLRGHY